MSAPVPHQSNIAFSIAHASQWVMFQPDDGSALQYGITTFIDDEIGELFTKEELDRHDPRIRAILDDMFRTQKAVDGPAISYSLIYWDNPEVIIPPEANFERDTEQPARSVYLVNYRRPDFNPTCLTIRVIDFDLATTPDGLKYVCSTLGRDVDISYDWLDSNHPGWREHYDTARSLGYTTQEALAHILAPLALPDASAVKLEFPETGIE